MSDKSASSKKPAKRGSKRSEPEPSVLGSLPSTRPTRLGRHAATTDGTPVAEKAPRARARASTTGTTTTRRSTTARATATPRSAAAKPKPRTPPPTPPREPAPEPERRSGPPSGPELVTTLVQATGEIAQIVVGIGVRALRQAARRIPRP